MLYFGLATADELLPLHGGKDRACKGIRSGTPGQARQSYFCLLHFFILAMMIVIHHASLSLSHYPYYFYCFFLGGCVSPNDFVCPSCQVQKWSAHDLNECKRICTGKCQAVQWVPSSHLCELWNVPVVHSMSQQGAECYAKKTDATKMSDALMPKERKESHQNSGC